MRARGKLLLDGFRHHTERQLVALLRKVEQDPEGPRLRDIVESQRAPVLLARVLVGPCRYVFSAWPSPSRKELSPREEQVALQAATGEATKNIARALEVREPTVETHLRRIYDKRDIRSRRDLHVEDLVKAAAARGRRPLGAGAWPILERVGAHLESLLEGLVRRVSRELGDPDLGRLLRGKMAPVVLADLRSDDCRYFLHAIIEPALVVLTVRQQEITVLVACGLPKKTIASALKIKVLSVKTHVQAIYSILGVHSQAALATLIMAQGPSPPRGGKPQGRGVGAGTQLN